MKQTACTAETQRTLRVQKRITTEITEKENMRTQRATLLCVLCASAVKDSNDRINK